MSWLALGAEVGLGAGDPGLPVGRGDDVDEGGGTVAVATALGEGPGGGVGSTLGVMHATAAMPTNVARARCGEVRA
jgi:hypothetical protein